MERSFLQIGGRLFRRAHVRLRHDLHQRHAGAVEIDIGLGRMLVMQALARILLQMQAGDADFAGLSFGKVEHDRALAHHRLGILGDLIAGGQIGVEIVLAVEHRAQIDLRVQAQAGAHRLLDADLVDHRQHAGKGRVHQADLRVRLGAEFRGGAGEQLGLGDHLGVDFQADDDFPGAGAPFDQCAVVFSHVQCSVGATCGRPAIAA